MFARKPVWAIVGQLLLNARKTSHIHILCLTIYRSDVQPSQILVRWLNGKTLAQTAKISLHRASPFHDENIVCDPSLVRPPINHMHTTPRIELQSSSTMEATCTPAECATTDSIILTILTRCTHIVLSCYDWVNFRQVRAAC